MRDWTTEDVKEFSRRLKRVAECMDECPAPIRAESGIDSALHLLGMAHHLSGIGCVDCSGTGAKTYGSTATWRGGIGGAAMTSGACDKCWGTGRTDKTGIDLRRLAALKPVSP